MDYELINERTGDRIATHVKKATSALQQGIGLLGRLSLPADEGIYFPGARSLHMCFMLFSIDVIYVDREMNVVKIVKNLKPWIGFSMCRSAYGFIELAKGVTTEKDVRVGDRLVLRAGES